MKVIVFIGFLALAHSAYVAIDAGSSGTRAYVFTTTSECNSIGGSRCKDDRFSFTPPFAKMTTDASNNLAAYLVQIATYLGLDPATNMFGGATAGLRNLNFPHQMKLTGSNNEIIRMLPGYVEALYEFIAVNADGLEGSYDKDLKTVLKARMDASGGLRNFLSTGGASAQLGLVIPDDHISGGEFHSFLAELGHCSSRTWLNFACVSGGPRPLSGGQYAPNFVALLRIKKDDGSVDISNINLAEVTSTNPAPSILRLYTKMTNDADKIVKQERIVEFCADHTCVLLLSFLAGESPDAEKKCHEGYTDSYINAEREVKPMRVGQKYHNLVGGQKETFYNLVNYFLPSSVSINANVFARGVATVTADPYESATYGPMGKKILSIFTDKSEVETQLRKMLDQDMYFHYVARYVKAVQAKESHTFYKAGAFTKYGGSKALTDDWAWAALFMEIVSSELGITISAMQQPANEGDWPYGMVYAKSSEVKVKKCTKIYKAGFPSPFDAFVDWVKDGATLGKVCEVGPLTLIVILENEIDSLI